jgi:pSer/pThr/pTyr-binding forkhead associated (FHA) protein
VPDSLLTVLKLLFLALLYLFFFRVLSAVWAELRPAPAGGPAPTPARAPSAGRGPATKLRVLAPAAAKGTSYDVGDEVTVGRAAGCGISLSGDSTVSQLHARLFRRDGRLYVEDLGSTNGTFVNGKAIGKPTELRAKDRLQVGSTVMELGR